MSLSASRLRPVTDFIEAGWLREMGLPTLVVSLVLFVSAMTLLSANISELRQGYARVERSNEALLSLEGIDNGILRGEMTVRGYILSGDLIYLTWRQGGEARMNDRLSTLKSLYAGDPLQNAHLAKLEALLAEHAELLDNVSRRALKDRESVIADMVAYSRRNGRRPIEETINAMRAEAMRQLAIEQLKAESRVVSAYRYAIGMSAVALLLAGLGFALLIHDRRHPRRTGGI